MDEANVNTMHVYFATCYLCFKGGFKMNLGYLVSLSILPPLFHKTACGTGTDSYGPDVPIVI